MKTWTLKLRGRQVQVKAMKADAERLSRAIRQAANVTKYWREISGVVGGKEYESVVSSLFGPGEGQIVNPEKYASDYAALFASIPDLITSDAIPSLIEQAMTIWREHLPIVDNRETPEQKNERRAEMDKIEQERKDKELAFARDYCASLEPIAIPEGQMAVTVEMSFDDSHMMTDYWCPHSQIGCDMLLGIVRKQPQREALAREMVNRYPELAALTWTWHTDNYSGGGGNYLESAWWGEVDRKAYDGRDTVSVRWIVRFDGYAKSMLPFRGYGTSRAKSDPEPAQGENGVTITYDRDWTWVKFDAKPGSEVLDLMNFKGGRFSGKRRAWYFTRHLEASELGLAM